jgi:hypothetical protein
MKLVSLLLAIAALAGATAGATSAAQTTSRSFCSTARSVAKSIVDSTTLPKGQVTPAALRTVYTKVADAEPALLATQPASLKPHLRPVFGFINVLIADYKQAGWKIGNMTAQLPTLAAQAQRVSPHIRVVKAYLNNTCKLDV